MGLVPAPPPPQLFSKQKAEYRDNLERLYAAYAQATEIGIPAGLVWRMSFATMVCFNDGTGGYIATLFGVPLDIDNGLSQGMVCLDGDGVQVTLEMEYESDG